MPVRIRCDTHPNYPLEQNGGFGGWLRGTTGGRLLLVRGSDNIVDVGLFAQDVFQVPNPWGEMWVEVKALRADGSPPTTADPAIFSQGGVGLAVTSITYWNAGLGASAQVILASADVDLLTSGTPAWMIITAQDTAGTDQVTLAAGRVRVV